jgi:hypothetical protein
VQEDRRATMARLLSGSQSILDRRDSDFLVAHRLHKKLGLTASLMID